MVDNKNLILAIVLSVAILFGFQFIWSQIYPEPPADAERTTTAPARDGAETPAAREPGAPAVAEPDAAPPTAPGSRPVAADPARPSVVPGAVPPSEASRQAALAATPRVTIDAPRVHGSISLIGGRLDDLTLADYHETVDPESPEIVLLSPSKSDQAYFAEVGWDDGGAGLTLPGSDAVWTADTTTLRPGEPVTLTWQNEDGLKFERTISVDENYLFTITQRVVSTLAAPVTLYPYALISRRGTPETSGFFILHEGPLGVFNGTLEEVDYDDVAEAGVIEHSSTGGWIGITDKYWLTTLVPDQTATTNYRFVHRLSGGTDVYQVDFVGGGVVVPAGGSAEWTARVFAGAKEARLLDYYEDTEGIANFDLAIDWGWFWFLTRPIFYALLWIQDVVGNFGVSILILTVAIKLLFFPLANKSYKAMSQMRKLQPEMLKLRERFGDDRQKLNQEMMALYKREKVNPASGCLPILIQIPVFFALYKVLFVTIEMRHAPFFGWIQDLSARDPTTIFNLFGLVPWQPPELLMIGIWPLIMGVSMYIQQKLNPQPPDPLQAKIFMALPVVFTVMLAQFPAGLVIYWTWNNILTILQQWVIMRRMGVKV